MEVPSHMLILYLAFGGTGKLFSIAPALVGIPTSNVQGFQFPHILSNTCYSPGICFCFVLLLQHYSHSGRCEVAFLCGFALLSLCTTATEPAHSTALRLQQEKLSPCSPQLEKACTATKTQYSQK